MGYTTVHVLCILNHACCLDYLKARLSLCTHDASHISAARNSTLQVLISFYFPPLSVHICLHLDHCLPFKSNQKRPLQQLYQSDTAAASTESYLHLIGQRMKDSEVNNHRMVSVQVCTAFGGTIILRLSLVRQQDFIA